MGKTYCHPAMKQLKDQQARFAPKERRLEQLEKAEQLLGEIDPAKRYPYEYLCFRITGYPPRRLVGPDASTGTTSSTTCGCSSRTCRRPSASRSSRRPSRC